MNNIFDLMVLIISGLQKNPKVRIWSTLISGFLTLGVVILLFTSEYFILPVAIGLRQLTPILTAAFGTMFLLSLASFAPINLKGAKIGDFELQSIREERKEIKRQISLRPKDVVGTIQLSLNQLTEYYAINKNQARSSFGWSIFAIIAGLVTLVGGIWLFYLNEMPNIQLATITGIASALEEFVGASYFFLYVKSLNQLNFFFTQLVRLQDTMLSIKLMEDIKDETKQDDMRRKLIIALMSRQTNLPILNSENESSGKALL